MTGEGAETSGGRGPSWGESLAFFAVLFAVWLLLSNHYDLPTLLIGAGCCALVVALTPDRVLQMGSFDPAFGVPLGRLRPLALVRFGFSLFWAIVVANFQVAWTVLHPRMPVEPRLVSFRVPFRSRVPQVVLAHSITLTPGTVTVDLRDGDYLVHSLLPASADSLASGAMQQGVAAAFGEPAGESPADLHWMDSIHETGEVRARTPGGAP